MNAPLLTVALSLACLAASGADSWTFLPPRDVDPALLPNNESLETTVERAVPFFNEVVKADMKAGKRVIIAAHGNSLRALVKYFDNLTPDEIIGVNIPTGVPLVYEFDDDFNVIRHYYLGDQDALKAKMEAVANQGKKKD